MKFGQGNSTWKKLEKKGLQDSLLTEIANFIKEKRATIKGDLTNKVAFWQELLWFT